MWNGLPKRSPRQDPSAANVADLAVALGSESSDIQSLAEIAATDGWGADAVTDANAEPTKVARSESVASAPTKEPTDAPAEPTAKPTKVRKNKQTPTTEPQATSEPEATDEPEPTDAAPKLTAVPKPTDVPPTPVPQPAPVTTEFIPAFPAGWWDAVKFIPAEVAPGTAILETKIRATVIGRPMTITKLAMVSPAAAWELQFTL